MITEHLTTALLHPCKNQLWLLFSQLLVIKAQIHQLRNEKFQQWDGLLVKSIKSAHLFWLSCRCEITIQLIERPSPLPWLTRLLIISGSRLIFTNSPAVNKWQLIPTRRLSGVISYFYCPYVRERCCFVEILPQQRGINVLLKRKGLACYCKHKNSRTATDLDAVWLFKHSHFIKSAPLFKNVNRGMCKSKCQGLDEAVSLFHIHNIP